MNDKVRIEKISNKRIVRTISFDSQYTEFLP